MAQLEGCWSTHFVWKVSREWIGGNGREMLGLNCTEKHECIYRHLSWSRGRFPARPIPPTLLVPTVVTSERKTHPYGAAPSPKEATHK